MKDVSQSVEIEEQQDEILSQILLYRSSFIREANETDWQHYLNSLIGGNTEAILSLSQATYNKHKTMPEDPVVEDKTKVAPVVLKPHVPSSSHRNILKEANRI